jgi:hypothetical protein
MMVGTILIWPTMEIIDLISAGKTHVGALVLTFIVISIISAGIIGFLYYLFFKFSTPKTIKGLREGDLFDEKEYIFNTEEIIITSMRSKSTFSWDSIRRIRDKNDSYYLYLNRSEAIIVPKRYFNEDGMERFKNMISNIEMVK